jgi:hypothetical protein
MITVPISQMIAENHLVWQSNYELAPQNTNTRKLLVVSGQRIAKMHLLWQSGYEIPPQNTIMGKGIGCFA